MSLKVSLSIVAVVILVTAWFAFDQNRQKFNKSYASVNSAGKYLKLSFNYPRIWSLAEDKRKIETYTQLTIKGPRNTDDTYTSAFVLRAYPVKKNGGRFESALQTKKNYTDYLYPDPKILSDTATRVSNVEALDVSAAYIAPKSFFKGFVSKAIPVQQRSLFFEKDEILYQVMYTADQREYPKYIEEFEHLLKSLRFNS